MFAPVDPLICGHRPKLLIPVPGVQGIPWYKVLYGTGWCMVQVQGIPWYRVLHGTGCCMVQGALWYRYRVFHGTEDRRHQRVHSTNPTFGVENKKIVGYGAHGDVLSRFVPTKI